MVTNTTSFSFQEVFFEAYVQYMEYSGFVDAMDSFRNMKWTKRIDGKVFHANVKVGRLISFGLNSASFLQKLGG